MNFAIMSRYSLLQNRQIRIFISSTFKDMEAERDYLVRKVFPVLKDKASKRDVAVIPLDLRWGITEQEAKNGKVLDICLSEIDNSFPFFIGIVGNRYGWCPSNEEVRHLEGKFEGITEAMFSGLSVTEIEMQYGVLSNPDDLHAIFYIKHDEDISIEKENPIKLQRLKESIRNNGRYPVSEYFSVEDLGNQIETAFDSLLDDLFPQHYISEAERETWRHQSYLNNLCRFYLPDEDGFNQLSSFLNSDYRICSVGGNPGIGKSALVANWIKTKVDPSRYYVVYHLVGTGNSGKSVEGILNRINTELNGNTDKESILVLDSPWSNLKPKEAGALWHQLIENEKVEKIISIDCFDRSNYDGDLLITPVIHTGQGYWREFVREYLKVFRKRLTNQQMEIIVAKPVIRNYTILRILLEEIISYGHYESLTQHILDLTSVSSSDEFYQKFLASLEHEYGIEVVRPILGCLSVSRHGLTEDMVAHISGKNQLRCSQFFNAIKGLLMASEGGRWCFISMNEAVGTRYGIINLSEEGYWDHWGPHAEEFRWLVINACGNESDHYSFSEKCYQLYCLGEYDNLLSFLPNYASFGLSQLDYVRELLYINHICSSKCTGPENDEYRFIVQLLSIISSICCEFNGPQVEIDDYSLWEYATSIPLYYNCLNDEERIGNTTITDYSNLKRALEKLASITVSHLTKRLETENDKRKRKRIFDALSDLQIDMKDASREILFVKYGEIADKHLQNNDYSSAAIAYETQVKYASDHNIKSIQNCYHQAAIAHVKARDLEAAKKAYSKSIEFLQKLSESDDCYKDKEAKELLSLGKLYMKNGGTEDGLRYFNMALSIYEDMLQTSEKQLLNCIRLLYAIHHRELLATSDDATIVDWFCREAAHGTPEMQYRYGRLCETGAVVEKNYAEACKWYILAAEQGYAKAQHHLARMFYCGQGVPENHENAFKWYYKAAENGYLAAQHMVGAMCFDGDGTEQDYKKAAEWYHTAAIQGNRASQYELGIMLLRGQGIDADSNSAVEWLKKSAEDGNHFRDIKEGDPDAQRVLGLMYMKGYLVPKDLERAFLLIKSSAAKKDIESIEILASMYYSGIGCEVDISRAAELYTKSAEAGLPESQQKLAHMYANGLGKEKDLGSAILWNGKALSQLTEQYGIHHKKTISCCNLQAWYLYLANNYDEALSYGQKAVSYFVEDTPATVKAHTLDTLADILSVLDRKKEALDYYNKSLDCFSLVLSEDDERLEEIRSKIQSLL